MSLFKRKKNVIVLGANGMLGHDVVELLMKEQKKENSCIGIVNALTHSDINITQEYDLSQIVNRRHLNPPIKYDYVINCAAMTDTMKIETDDIYRNQAYAVNAIGPKNIAKTCAYHKIKLIHISTDYVFSERSAKNYLPFRTSGYTIDAFHKNNAFEFPVNIYGMQKLIGEKFIKENMKEKNYTILRTSWLYGQHNNKSFVHNFLKNFMIKKKTYDAAPNSEIFEFEMTQNEYSIPTSTNALAKMILNTIKYNLHGTFAACGTSESDIKYAVSRKQWAEEILKLWLKPEELEQYKIVGVDRDTLAPKYSRMYNSFNSNNDYKKLYNCANYVWQQELRWFLSEHKDSIEKFIES